ncbi:hypothetical protein MT962_000639 [Franconibacter sp. IITDAS19]|uniref:hypothetical protein n=1 Tax=Franconibacter sp. IITDAS19 TaxID=2930569 RepID=UPI001FF7E8D2|nr:hypothetical protein [Franconibacter sp. IITDAS19]MCK1966853.1 hypothetical protein [Franconibacter sp. IITDAS19]
MALEILTKEFFVGVAAAIPAALGGWAAFGRMRSTNKALNAADSQSVAMMDRLVKENEGHKETIKEKEEEIRQKDAQIREYFESSVKSQARLEALESSMAYLREQNTMLTNQVREMTLEISHLRSSLRS